MTEKQVEHIGGDLAERRKAGKGLREQTPRSSHGNWAPAADRPDPLSLLQAQDKGRIQQLLPIKYGRYGGLAICFSARIGCRYGL